MEINIKLVQTVDGNGMLQNKDVYSSNFQKKILLNINGYIS